MQLPLCHDWDGLFTQAGISLKARDFSDIKECDVSHLGCPKKSNLLGVSTSVVISTTTVLFFICLTVNYVYAEFIWMLRS